MAVVDATGKLLETATIYPHQPRHDWQGSLATLARLVVKHDVRLISIGNGTAGRETDKLASRSHQAGRGAKTGTQVDQDRGQRSRRFGLFGLGSAAAEFPDLDVSLRGAVSIARRLQDPLAELVKIDPKSIGVGQYQHDVNQTCIGAKLDATVEDCVNCGRRGCEHGVGAAACAGVGPEPALAQNIVDYRDANGAVPESRLRSARCRA